MLACIVYINCLLSMSRLACVVYITCLLSMSTLACVVYINCLLSMSRLACVVYINCLLSMSMLTCIVYIDCLLSMSRYTSDNKSRRIHKTTHRTHCCHFAHLSLWCIIYLIHSLCLWRRTSYSICIIHMLYATGCRTHIIHNLSTSMKAVQAVVYTLYTVSLCLWSLYRL